MRISLAYTIDADIDAFCQSFWNRAFLEAKYEAMGARDIAIEIEEDHDGARIVTSEREVPMEAPALLESVIGSHSRVRQVERWSGGPGGPYRCVIEVEPQGLPATARGEIVVERTAEGCELRCDTEARCTMPLVGSMAERFMAADIEKRLDAEIEYVAVTL